MATMSFEAFRISVPLADNKEWAKTMVRISSLYSWGISKCSPPPLHFMPCIHSIIQYINHFLLQCSCDMSWVSSFIMHICTSMALLVSSLLLFASHYGDKTATIKTAVDGLFSWNMYDSFRSPPHIYRMANFLFHFFSLTFYLNYYQLSVFLLKWLEQHKSSHDWPQTCQCCSPMLNMGFWMSPPLLHRNSAAMEYDITTNRSII